MASLQAPHDALGSTPAVTLCCLCGLPLTSPSPNNTCITCATSRGASHASDRVPKTYSLVYCKNCTRYLKPPDAWILADLESHELMSLCLSRLQKLENARITDARFVWTEPHSRRIKIRLTLQEQHPSSLTVLQQSFTVEYIVSTMQCPSCTRLAAQNTWLVNVQVRQRVPHKRTFLYLEQLILKQNLHRNCSNIRSVKHGVDFHFLQKNHAMAFQAWLERTVPCKAGWSVQLVGEDLNNNLKKYKWSCVVELAHVCRDDIVHLDKTARKKLGGIGPLALCFRVQSLLCFVDPFSLRTFNMNYQDLTVHDPRILMTPARLVPFLVVDVEPVGDDLVQPRSKLAHGAFSLVRITVAREKDNKEFSTLSHLGHLLRSGDTALGYDFTEYVGQGDGDDDEDPSAWPSDIVLVRKQYVRTKKRRNWRLRRYPQDIATTAADPDDMSDTEDAIAPSVSMATTHRTTQTLRSNVARKRQKQERLETRKRLRAQRKEAHQRERHRHPPQNRSEAGRGELDYERFLQELEEDRAMRRQVDIFRALASDADEDQNGERTAREGDGEEGGDPLMIPVEEMLERLDLSD